MVHKGNRGYRKSVSDQALHEGGKIDFPGSKTLAPPRLWPRSLLALLSVYLVLDKKLNSFSICQGLRGSPSLVWLSTNHHTSQNLREFCQVLSKIGFILEPGGEHQSEGVLQRLEGTC